MPKVPGLIGSYTIRSNGTCQIKISTGWDAGKGEYSCYRETLPNAHEAEKALEDITQFLKFGGGKKTVASIASHRHPAEGPACEQDTMTLSRLSDAFLEARRRDKEIAARTRETTEGHIKKLKPFLGETTLSEANAAYFESLKLDLRDDSHPANKGKGCSGTYAQKLFATIKQMLDWAVQCGLCKENNAKKVKSPQRDTPEKRILPIAKTANLIEKIGSEPLDSCRVGLVLLASTGCRLSEMLALKWSDYDADSSVLRIERAMEKDSQNTKQTKGKESREMPLMPRIAALLSDWKEQQRHWYQECNLEWSLDAPIVQSTNAKHVLSSTYERWWRQNRIKLGLDENATLHAFRHGFASYLIVECGVDPTTVQSLTGHHNPDVLMKIYSHTHGDAKRAAMLKLQRTIVPFSGREECRHCRHWSPSPNDVSVGVCWASKDEAAKQVVHSNEVCRIGSFSLNPEQ